MELYCSLYAKYYCTSNINRETNTFPPENIIVNKNGKPKDFPFLLLGGGDENRTRVQNDKKISFYANSHI